MPDPLLGQTLGDFRVEALLGQGSAASVYRAVQRSFDRPVALKVFSTEVLPPVLLAERFPAEAAALARLEHPLLLPVYGAVAQGEVFAIALRLARGRTLAAWLREPRTAAELLSVLSDVASALAAVHDMDEVHRALTPGNVFVEHARGVIADRGPARLLDEAGAFRGSTASHVPPEGARGEAATPAWDVWSFGVLLHEALAGRPPFPGEDRGAPLPLGRADVPEALEAIARRCLAADRAARFADGAELARALAAVLAPASKPSASAPRGERAAPGKTFGRYRILAQLGKGAMGVVYRAYDPSLDRQVALKVLQTGAESRPEMQQRFEREARSAAKVRHPNAIAVYDVGQEEGRAYFTMELVEGTPFDRWLKGEGRPGGSAPTLRAIVSAVEAVARALGAAHAIGVVHRDVKPGNILVDARDQPHLGDFGLARQVQEEGASRLTRPGAILGTPAYMSPEQANMESDTVGPQSDVFSLGAVLYLALVGESPFAAQNPLACLKRILTEEPVPPSKRAAAVPRELDAVCRKALAKAREKRYPNGDAMADDLRAYLFGRTLSISVPSPAPPPAARGAAPPPTRPASDRPTRSTRVVSGAEASMACLLFGQVAVRLSLAEPQQVQEGLARQERYRGLSVQKPIGAVLQEMGVLDEAAVLRVLKAQGARVEGTPSALAARVAVENGLASQAQVDECLAAGKGTRALADLLFERKAIGEQGRRAMQRALLRLTQGPTLRTTTVAWGVIECPGCYESVSRKASRCPHCGEALHVEELSLAPVQCPRCKAERTGEGEVCVRCGTNLVTGELISAASARTCPGCGTRLAELQQVCFECGAHLPVPFGLRLRDWLSRVTGWRAET